MHDHERRISEMEARVQNHDRALYGDNKANGVLADVRAIKHSRALMLGLIVTLAANLLITILAALLRLT
jgi:hypothetical protein